MQNSKQDFQIIIQQLRPNPESDMEPNFKYIVEKQTESWQPQTVASMANFICIEQDFILVADIYKNFQVFKRKDSEELKKDKQEDKDFISLKKRFQSKMDSNCVAVYSFHSLEGVQL